MIPIISLLFVVVLSLVITRIATIALIHTGLSRESARFQARSAFTGVGFTTRESEHVVNHPVRRRILMNLMLLGNIGIVTAASTLMLSFVNSAGMGQSAQRLALLFGGAAVLLAIAMSPWVDRRLARIIAWGLRRWTSLETRDYAQLLHTIGGEYGVAEMRVEAGHWLAGRSIAELALNAEGVVLLGVQRPSGVYLGAPRPDRVLEPHDLLIVYGRCSRVAELEGRAAGADGGHCHADACAEHERLRAAEARADTAT